MFLILIQLALSVVKGKVVAESRPGGLKLEVDVDVIVDIDVNAEGLLNCEFCHKVNPRESGSGIRQVTLSQREEATTKVEKGKTWRS